ncbi:hypothetical protein HY212_01010 [Candidatus Pacearchaeota archaeon]|nr:hypothetical protein [Candidatus Pacearchaeota archaeon]
MNKVILQKKGSGKHNSRTTSHMPRLDTIEMVEELISDKKEFSSKNRLWRALPKQVQYPTLLTILKYLERSNKIMYDKEGSILWIFVDNLKLKKLHKESTLLR